MPKKTKQKIQKRQATQNPKRSSGTPEARLTKLIKFCKDNNILKVEMDGIKLEIAPDKPNYDSKDPILTPDTYTDEQILMWSTNGQNY